MLMRFFIRPFTLFLILLALSWLAVIGTVEAVWGAVELVEVLI